MGYKSVITTWKKIQDWVLELLEGLGLGTAYKYDKASDTATVKAGTIKNESGSFAWINSLGQWIINLGTNTAETWGILGNYRFGQDSNGNGTWNGIYQRDGNGNNFEVLHSDDSITQLKFKGEERFAASEYNTQLQQISKGNTSRRAIVQLGSSEVHIGTAPTNYDSVYNGIEISQYHGDTEIVAFKYKGKYALMFIPSGSFSLGAVYKGIIYNAIRSGRDIMDKGFYTELLMANRAYQQIGVWETGGMTPTPPTPYTPSAGEYDYRFEYDALGRLIYECKEGYQKFYHPDNGAAFLDVYRSTVSTTYRVVFNENLKIAGDLNVTGLSFNGGNADFGGTMYQSGIKADYKQVTTSGSGKKAFKTYYYEYSGTYDAANPQFALYKSQMGSPFTTLDIAGRCRHMHATIKFTNSSNNLNIFNLCDKCYICNSSGDVWVNLNDVTYQMTDGTAYTIFFQFEIEES